MTERLHGNNAIIDQTDNKYTWTYLENSLNTFCEKYGAGTGAAGARCLKIEDLDNLTKYDKTEYKTEKDIEKYGNVVKYTMDGTKVRYQISGGEPVTTTETTFTMQGGVPLGSVVLKELEVRNDYYTYTVSKLLTGSAKEMIGKGDYYLLASSYIKTSEENVDFGLRFFLAGGIYGNSLWNSKKGAGTIDSMKKVKPVVILNADTQLQETTSGSHEWNIVV